MSADHAVQDGALNIIDVIAFRNGGHALDKRSLSGGSLDLFTRVWAA